MFVDLLDSRCDNKHVLCKSRFIPYYSFMKQCHPTLVYG